MKSQIILPFALTASLALLGACQKTPAQTDTTTSTTTAAATAPTDGSTVNPPPGTPSAPGATDSGGAVSPPAANGAINTDANKSSSDVAAASNSFTEAEAKKHIEKAGYANVTGLTKTPDGLWTAQATKGGKTVVVMVDFKGAVTAS